MNIISIFKSIRMFEGKWSHPLYCIVFGPTKHYVRTIDGKWEGGKIE